METKISTYYAVVSAEGYIADDWTRTDKKSRAKWFSSEADARAACQTILDEIVPHPCVD